MIDTKRIPWERMGEETPQAYFAFCLYRDLGPGRSIDRAHALFLQHRDPTSETGTETASETVSSPTLQKSNKRATGNWNRWSAENVWVERAAAYDLDCERRKRRELERQREVDYTKDLEDYRHRQKLLASRTQEYAITLMQLAGRKLNTTLKVVNDGMAEGATEEQKYDAKCALRDIPTKTLPAFFRAAASLAEAGTNAEAQALGLMDLMKALDGSDTSHHQ